MKLYLTIMAMTALMSSPVCLAANGILGGRVDYAVGDAPEGIVTADFDNDGDFDLAVANKGPLIGTGDSLSVLMNNGDGTFQAPVKYAGGRSYHSLTTADFDRDGDYDLAATSRINGYVSILVNNGDGTFDLTYNYAAGSAPSWIFAADLNHDEYPDLAVSNAFSMFVSVLINKGDGTFFGRVNYDASDGGHSVAVADFNGDGNNDLAVGTMLTIDVLFNDGYGTFEANIPISLGWQSPYVCAVDLNHDDRIDIAAGRMNDSVAVFLNSGDTTFYGPASYGANDIPTTVISADFDRDGNNDLATANHFAGTISVLFNDGAGHFYQEEEFGAGDRTGVVCAADFDGDGDDDVAASNSATDNITVYFNQTYTGFAAFAYDTVNSITAYTPDPIDAYIYAGAFGGGYTVDQIDPFMVSINGQIAPHTFSIISDHPDIPGDVLEMAFDLREFIGSYGLQWETDIQIYTVFGQYNDGTPFAVGGNIVLIGLHAGDASLDGRTDIGDPVFIINYLYRQGSEPALDATADANADMIVDMGDAVYLLNYIFRDGPKPIHP